MDGLRSDGIRKAVREQYGKVAESGGSGCGCSVVSCCGESGSDAVARSVELGYSRGDVAEVPEGANMGLGCGNPQAIASLKIGETVLDLGSGGGFDCFLAVKEVGDSGRVIGVDMTAEMVSRARVNADKVGCSNVDFRLGEIENLPVADGVVDVIMSNCVINLSPEKRRVFKESFRVLKPGGRLAISDVVAFAELPEKLKDDMGLLVGCMAGAASIAEIEGLLEGVGFEAVVVRPVVGSRDFIRDWMPGSGLEDYVVSAVIEAVKPMVWE